MITISLTYNVGFGDEQVEDVDPAREKFLQTVAQRLLDRGGELDELGVVNLVNAVVGTVVLNALGDPVVDQNFLHVVAVFGDQLGDAVSVDGGDDLDIFKDVGHSVLCGALHGVEELGLRPHHHPQDGRHEGGRTVDSWPGELWLEGSVPEVERHAALFHPVDGAQQTRDRHEDSDDDEDPEEDDG